MTREMEGMEKAGSKGMEVQAGGRARTIATRLAQGVTLYLTERRRCN